MADQRIRRWGEDMPSSGSYGDSFEDYIRDLVTLGAPNYDMWRPYFEFDIELMTARFDSDNPFIRSLARDQVRELSKRFLDSTAPMWVREQILSRVIKMYLNGGDARIADAFSEFVSDRVRRPDMYLVLEDMMEKSELVLGTFAGAVMS